MSDEKKAAADAVKPTDHQTVDHANEKKTVVTDQQATKNQNASISVPKSLISALLLLVVVVASFYAGMAYQKNQHEVLSARMMKFQDGPGGFGFRTEGPQGFGGRMGIRGTIGTVTAVSSSSITVKDDRSDTTATYSITGSTTVIDDGQAVNVSNIKVGDEVVVKTSSSSSSTATVIILNPEIGIHNNFRPGSSDMPVPDTSIETN